MIYITCSNLNIEGGFQLDKNPIVLRIEGHSGQKSKGYDVICAAVSALAQTLVLSIHRIANIRQNIEQRDGFLRTEISIVGLTEKQINDLTVLYGSFFIGITEICRNYKDTITITFDK